MRIKGGDDAAIENNGNRKELDMGGRSSAEQNFQKDIDALRKEFETLLENDDILSEAAMASKQARAQRYYNQVFRVVHRQGERKPKARPIRPGSYNHDDWKKCNALIIYDAKGDRIANGGTRVVDLLQLAQVTCKVMAIRREAEAKRLQDEEKQISAGAAWKKVKKKEPPVQPKPHAESARRRALCEHPLGNAEEA